jgi:hypothetical protein
MRLSVKYIYITLNGQKNLPLNGIHYRQLHHYLEGIAPSPLFISFLKLQDPKQEVNYLL